MPSDASTADVTEKPAEDAAPNPVEEVVEAVDTHEATATQTPLRDLIPRHPLVPVFCIGLPILAIGVFGLERRALIAAIACVVLTLLAAIDIE
ncbi:MAG TPA: hypothetical protein VNT54_07905, partial [Solirubrobacteraceae bacterium]|nr:hypothetical protein [Solirubrobacteraceae bacterium]